MAQGQVFEQHVAPGFQPGYSKTENNFQPTRHAEEDSGKLNRNRAFLTRWSFCQPQGWDCINTSILPIRWGLLMKAIGILPCL